MEKKEEGGRSCFEQKSIVKKWQFRVMVVSHWLNSWGSQFLGGDAMYIFFCWDLWLMILSC